MRTVPDPESRSPRLGSSPPRLRVKNCDATMRARRCGGAARGRHSPRGATTRCTTLPLAAWVLSTPCEPRHVGCMDVWLPRELVGGRPTSITSRQEGPDVLPDRNTHQAQAC